MATRSIRPRHPVGTPASYPTPDTTSAVEVLPGTSCDRPRSLPDRRDVHDAKHEQQRLLAGDAWWGSDTQNRMLSKGHKHWERYRDGIQVLAATPARTERHLKQKRELIGRLWLGAEGEWYDQLRAGIAADVEWLRENAEPVRRRRRPF